MSFPYGTASFIILLIAIVTGIIVVVDDASTHSSRPDLVFCTFTKEHAAAYGPVIADFERRHNVKVQLQVVSQQALQGRLQSAMQVGAEVPDMVELLDGTLGVFAKGPVEDVGFVDLTDRLRRAGLLDRIVFSRFGKWSSRGHIFALPHDVHPIMLAYRRDIVEQLGIDVSRLQTWEEFSRVGREVVTKDIDGDGNADRYMIDLPSDGSDALRLLLLQRGGEIFDKQGQVAFDSDATADVMCWFIHQISGKGRIAFSAGWGQNLAKTMNDGLVLFYICPDWRVKQFETDVPGLSGKLALMPLPAWEPGGRRTSTWGGTGLAITRNCKRPDLAWELAMELYYNSKTLGKRYASTRILPPLKEAWSEPEFDAPEPYFSNQVIGRMYSSLAQDVPEEQCNAYTSLAIAKLSEAFSKSLLYYESHGDDGLKAYAREQLKASAERVKEIAQRNRFLNDSPVASQVGGK